MTQAVGLVYALVAAIAFGIQYVPAPLQSWRGGGGKTPTTEKSHLRKEDPKRALSLGDNIVHGW